jgi:NAD(P)-dependent dehydrogenase (short-subunit alcohol dehydrogenase family)
MTAWIVCGLIVLVLAAAVWQSLKPAPTENAGGGTGILATGLPREGDVVREQSPLGRPGQPAELASIYVHLAAADASYATGHVYGAAGGGG